MVSSTVTLSGTEVKNMAGKVRAALKNFGRLALRRLVSLGVILVTAVFVGICVLASVNLSNAPSLPTLVGPGSPTDAAKPDQSLLDKVSASDAGRLLHKQGFTATMQILDPNLTKWFDEQEGHQNVPHPGPYVLFAHDNRQANKPGSDVMPQIVVDAANQVQAGVYQVYTDRRGLACYNEGDIANLRSNWEALNVYLWKKSLDQSYDVTTAQLPELKGIPVPVHCYAFAP